MEATRLLKQDHYRLRELLKRYDAQDADDARRQHLFEMIYSELDTHVRIEEEIFYPAVRDAVPGGEAAVAGGIEEHRTIQLLMRELARLPPAMPEFRTRMELLRDRVLEHMDGEQAGRGTFALAQALPRERLLELGTLMAARRESMTSDWVGAAAQWLGRLVPGA